MLEQMFQSFQTLNQTSVYSGEEAVPAKKTKTVISTSEVSQTRQTRVEKVREDFICIQSNIWFNIFIDLVTDIEYLLILSSSKLI